METAISIGNFDGVHLGHLYLLERLKEEAFKRNLKPLVITFEPHPAEVLKKNGNFCKILTGEEKREIIEGQLGIETVVLPFTENFSRVLPEEFVKDYLINRFNAKVVVVGYDWHFGRDASGDFILLSGICKKFGCEALKVEPYTVGGKIVSSTPIIIIISSTPEPVIEPKRLTRNGIPIFPNPISFCSTTISITL